MASRIARSNAEQFVRCLRGGDPGLVRPIVEGHFADPQTQFALDRVIRSNVACYPDFARSPRPDYFGKCNPVIVTERSAICRSVYDRAAFIESALAEYAPHFLLTRADTLDADVIARFRKREEVRGKFRGQTDRRFYITVACMVQLEPEKAVGLLRAAPNSDAEASLRVQILLNTKQCTGSAKRVSLDPNQFRGYLADAFYHWTIAARNIETLIPAS